MLLGSKKSAIEKDPNFYQPENINSNFRLRHFLYNGEHNDSSTGTMSVYTSPYIEIQIIE